MKKILIALLIAGIAAAGVYYGFNCYSGSQEKKIATLEDKINLLKEETCPMRFLILEKDSANITAAVKFLNQDGMEIAHDTVKMAGEELSFDFYVTPVKDTAGVKAHVAFPYKIFSDKVAAKDGIILFDLYNKEGFPEIFASEGIDDADYHRTMSELFEKICKGDTENIDGAFGSMVQDVKNLDAFAEGHAYEIIVRKKGGIEIKEYK